MSTVTTVNSGFEALSNSIANSFPSPLSVLLGPTLPATATVGSLVLLLEATLVVDSRKGARVLIGLLWPPAAERGNAPPDLRRPETTPREVPAIVIPVVDITITINPFPLSLSCRSERGTSRGVMRISVLTPPVPLAWHVSSKRIFKGRSSEREKNIFLGAKFTFFLMIGRRSQPEQADQVPVLERDGEVGGSRDYCNGGIGVGGGGPRDGDPARRRPRDDPPGLGRLDVLVPAGKQN